MKTYGRLRAPKVKCAAYDSPWQYYWRETDGRADCGVFWEKMPSHVYSVCRAPQYEKKEQWLANARLIAAAPELLAIAKAAEKFYVQELDAIGECDHAVGICACGVVSELETIREVIAKAEGR